MTTHTRSGGAESRPITAQVAQAERMVKRAPLCLQTAMVGASAAVLIPMADKGEGDH